MNNELEKSDFVKDYSSVKKNKLVVFVTLIILVLTTIAVFISVRSNSKSKNQPRNYSLTDVSRHDNKGDCWTVINGEVYDISKFIPFHKGGDVILNACGSDATDLFTGKSPMGRVHSKVAIKLLGGMKIGVFQNPGK